jgi:uncharacterized small protein (DUF1192 family)
MNLQTFYNRDSLKIFSLKELQKLQMILQNKIIKLEKDTVNKDKCRDIQERFDRITWELIRRVVLENATPQTPPIQKFFD